MNQTFPSTTLVIFGISGDLAGRYLLPALSEICQNQDIKTRLDILGLSRRDISKDDVLSKPITNLSDQLEIFKMDYEQDGEYKKLRTKLDSLGPDQIIFYFAVPPQAVLPIVSKLGRAGLNSPKYRLLMEKPFGIDLASAKQLVQQTQAYFKEQQIYRIDHYLAKEMAQNIAVFLGSNALFRHVWNKEHIEYIEIVVAEKIGIEGRGGFYEQTGSLRDMAQSHLLQLAALSLMEPCPHDFDFNELPNRRLQALKHLKVPQSKMNQAVFRGQYAGYRQDVGNSMSNTETFVALQLESDAPRWQGVPIYLATGKKLDQKLTQIRINFKKDNQSEANMLILRIQPREGIELDLWVKQPGYERKLEKKILSFSYEQDFADRLPNAYEQILVDAIRGSHSLFASSDEVLESWRILQPVLDYWAKSKEKIKQYKPGSTVEQVLGGQST
jgi:glucose-6-phosphate 1-dehydrogenase